MHLDPVIVSPGALSTLVLLLTSQITQQSQVSSTSQETNPLFFLLTAIEIASTALMPSSVWYLNG